MTRKRCPKGSNRNKKTGRCNKNKHVKVKPANVKTLKKPTCPSVKQSIQHKVLSPHKPKIIKRCPKGTRKNKKTGLCDSINLVAKTNELSITNIINVMPVENIVELGKIVHKTVESLKKEKEITLKTPSFNPEINKHLVTLNMKTPSDITAYKCIETETQENLYDGLTSNDMKDILKHDQYFDSDYLSRLSKSINVNNKDDVLQELIKIAKNPPSRTKVRVKIGTEYRCFEINDVRLKTLMLENLHSKKDIDFSKITGPQQYLSNCWFNTAMMCLFISDKGRKFTRAMRENMINGNINPDISQDVKIKLTNVLTMFNIIIDNALRGILDVSINTNYIIQSLHTINSEFSRKFVKSSKSWNPISFFDKFSDLMESPKLHLIKHSFDTQLIKPSLSRFKDDVFIKYNTETIPDIIVFEFYDSKLFDLNLKGQLLGLEYLDQNGKTVKATHTMTFNTHNDGGIKYKLDSAVLRSNNKKHFSAFITGNGEQYRFDGHTKSHLQPFEWKKILNKNKNSNFKKDETPKKWKGNIFNFSKAYHLLFYYRI